MILAGKKKYILIFVLWQIFLPTRVNKNPFQKMYELVFKYFGEQFKIYKLPLR